METQVLKLSNVSFSYPQANRNALTDVSVSIERGQYIAVVGTNGSGKSTLARVLAGFIEPDEGTVERSENAIEGIVFQHPREQIVAGVVERDTAFGPKNLNLSKSEVELRTMECLSVVDLADRAFSRTTQLSLGQTQRLALAGILALFPDLLILDETTAMLDPNTRAEVIEFIDQWNRKGNSIVHITHDEEEVRHASRVLVLEQGKLVFDASSADFFADEAMVQSVFGSDDELIHAKQSASVAEDAPLSLSVKNLSFSYSDRMVFEKLSFTLQKGTLTALTGPSGCGKSTLLECLAGLLIPSSGTIRSVSRPLLALQDTEAALFEPFSADDVAFGARAQGVTGKKLRQRVIHAMDAAGVPFADFADRQTFRLSGGEKRKLSLAGIVALEGDVYLFDEPTAGLDAQSRRTVMLLLRKLAQEGKTVLFTTHRMNEAQFADRQLSWDELTKVTVSAGDDTNIQLKDMPPVRNAEMLAGIRKASASFLGTVQIPDSPVAKLPPVVKYLVFLAMFTLSICFKTVLPCACVLGVTILYALLARYPISKPTIAILKFSPWILLIVVFQLIFFPAQADEIRYVDLSWLVITPSKIQLCVCSVLRIVSCVNTMGVFMFTIDERQLLDGLSDLLILIALINKAAVRNIVLVVGIIFRFIPLLLEEAASIVKTQIIRGAFGQSKGFKKFKQLVPLFAPLMIQTFRKAELFSHALTARYFR